MNRIPSLAGFLMVGLTLLLAQTATASVNKNITIGDGESSRGASSVNGNLTVGENATVTGNLETVNGSIKIGENSVVEDVETVNGGIRLRSQVRTEDLDTVNGPIRLDAGVQVAGSITAVNGSISLAAGSTVARDVSNVNGTIELIASEVGGDVSTVSGDVELADQAVVRGDLVVEESHSSGVFRMTSTTPKVVVGPGSRIDGVIRLERKVKLYISDSASVGGVEGVMSLADAVRFSGNHP